MDDALGLVGLSFAVLTSSDLGAAGGREDTSGRLLVDGLQRQGATVVDHVVLPDDYDRLRDQLAAWTAQDIRIVLTTGGTGLGPRDVMPEVTRSLIDREVPGIMEHLRQQSVRSTPLGMLSRGIAGVRYRSLIINLPGSPRAIEQLLPLLYPILPHVGNLLTGNTAH